MIMILLTQSTSRAVDLISTVQAAATSQPYYCNIAYIHAILEMDPTVACCRTATKKDRTDAENLIL